MTRFIFEFSTSQTAVNASVVAGGLVIVVLRGSADRASYLQARNSPVIAKIELSGQKQPQQPLYRGLGPNSGHARVKPTSIRKEVTFSLAIGCSWAHGAGLALRFGRGHFIW